MKKILAALLSAALIFSPVGNIVFQDHTPTVEAKGYKSGKKSFKMDNNNTNTNTSFFQKKKENTETTSKSANPKGGFTSGKLMKGLMVGGLAGLLFGSLFANMGMLGSILGLMVNLLAIYFLFSIIRTLFSYYKNKKRKEDASSWRN